MALDNLNSWQTGSGLLSKGWTSPDSWRYHLNYDAFAERDRSCRWEPVIGRVSWQLVHGSFERIVAVFDNRRGLPMISGMMLKMQEIFLARDLMQEMRVEEANRVLAEWLSLDASTPVLSSKSILEPLAKQALLQMNWHKAYCLYSLLHTSKHGFGWLCKKLKWRLEHQSEFMALYNNDVHSQRIEALIKAKFMKNLLSLRTSNLPVGYIGMATYKHELILEGASSPLVLFEKVFEYADLLNAERESLLFSSITTRDLRAPDFYGMDQQNDFISLYYEFVDGRRVDDDQVWGEISLDLLYHFWSITPPAALTENPLTPCGLANSILAKIVNHSVFPKARKSLCSTNPEMEGIKDIIEERLTFIKTVISEMPLFVFHLDFHGGNVIESIDGSSKVVDWEQWSLEPIGFGWLPFRDYEPIEMIEIGRLRQRRLMPESVTTAHLMLMASIWGYWNAAERQDDQLAAIWLKRLVKFSNPS